MSSIRVAILTISDTAATDATADKSGPTIQNILQHRGFDCTPPTIVSDDEARIQTFVKDCVERRTIDWIITTGGTGFGVRDRTPEAISPLIERHAPGLVHLMMSASLKHTPLAALSRPVAGTIKNTLILTLPGSVKAVKENLDALLSGGLVDHAIELIRGGNGKQVHSILASGGFSNTDVSGQLPTSHDHHHHIHSHNQPQPRTILSHDPSLSASARHRISPYELVSFEMAMEIILREVQPLSTCRKSVTPALKGHVLAEDVLSPQNVPFTQTTSVDGYALRSTDLPGIYEVVTPQTHMLSTTLPNGSIYRINTGGPLPRGADTVIMVEDTRLVSTHKDADGKDSEEKEVETLAQIPVGENIREPGSDVKTNELVLQKGEVITSRGGEIGTLAFVGRKEVEVYRKPVVALLSTGNEVVDLQAKNSHSSDDWGGVFDTNRPSLQAALEGMGYEVVDLGVVSDDIASHVSAIKQGLDEADILLTTGGTSMGSSDLLKPVIERYFNGTIHFGRVTVKPGKPTTFGTIPIPEGKGSERKPVFALPGNPASALVTLYVFVIPTLRKLGGWPMLQCQLPRVRVYLQNAMKLDSRTEFHRVVIQTGKNCLTATSTGGQRSSRIASLSGANGLVVLPPCKENGPHKLEVGEFADAVVIGEIQMS